MKVFEHSKTYKLLQMELVKMTIELSISRITTLAQVSGTHNWIKVFEKRFGATDVACELREKLNEVQL